MLHHVDGVVDDVGVVVVEGDQLAVPLERLEAVAAGGTSRCRRPRDGLAVAREVGADVVEHAVEQDAQPAPVRLRDEVVEVGVVAEPRVDAVVVGGVVAVRAGGEYRAERDTRRAEFDGVVEPFDDPAQPVLVGRRRRVGGKGADEAERIDLPPDRVLDPPAVRMSVRAKTRHGRNFAS